MNPADNIMGERHSAESIETTPAVSTPPVYGAEQAQKNPHDHGNSEQDKQYSKDEDEDEDEDNASDDCSVELTISVARSTSLLLVEDVNGVKGCVTDASEDNTTSELSEETGFSDVTSEEIGEEAVSLLFEVVSADSESELDPELLENDFSSSSASTELFSTCGAEAVTL